MTQGRAGSLILALLCWLACGPAVAQDSCGQFSWSVGARVDLFSGYIPTFPSGQLLMKEGVFALRLEPDMEKWPGPASGPSPAAAGTYGGLVTVESIAGSRYRLALSEIARVEVFQDRWSLPLLVVDDNPQCPGVRRLVEFTADYGSLVVELSGVRLPLVHIAIVPIPR